MLFQSFPKQITTKKQIANIYLFKVNNRSGAFIVNFEHISHRFLEFLLLNLNK